MSLARTRPAYHPTETHHHDPNTFATDVLNLSLWDKQRQVLTLLSEFPRVAVKSGNGLGKTMTAAATLLWFISTHNPSIALSTAPTFRQVRHLLWREIARLHTTAPYNLGGEMLDVRWEISDSQYALGLSSDSADEFQGFHSPNMLVIVDEAAGVEDPIYEAIEAIMTSANCKLLLIGNPTSMSGAFRRAFYEERTLYQCITMSAFDSPNVKANQIVVRGLTTADWVEERKTIWGEESAAYQARVLGEFPDQAEDTLIALSWAERAQERVLEDNGDDRLVIGVDVARYGGDKSIILTRRGQTVDSIKEFRSLDTMALAGRVATIITEQQPHDCLIDEIGIGAGVVDRLRETHQHVKGINVANQARDAEHFANLRAEGYWNLRRLFQDGLISIPRDPELIGQISTLKYSYNSLGRIIIESKEDIRKRGAPSPDKADALMLAFLTTTRRTKIWT